ncbi:competence type IV pilus minor pilin ComGG [Thermaerobacillus caldiproteolyticus]|uniref:competence type IV pilus minor pilin ComGG n=1 Tax=Thermaerobacillus caldiproteolyticus TaxID=247480 RepID=UPI00188A5650|nr:competence type IV pilus minor pilin ComGG [Anoxybacillus caldiproteolyticus]QPA30041.1 hypothetical protein ISX45_10250 [Anoxybacillus caldiproteolyticus]
MKNEKGMIFPITMLVSFLFLFIFVRMLELYKTETEMAKYEQQSYEVDSVMQMAVTDVKRQLAVMWPTDTSNRGTLTYPNGVANYEWKQMSEHEMKVTIFATSHDGIHYGAECIISLPELELIEWKEKY